MIFIRHAFAIEESMLPNLVSREWFLHDMNNLGVHYLVGVCLNTRNIVFLSDQHGGGKCLIGVIRDNIKSLLEPGENIVACNAMGFNFRNKELLCVFCPPSVHYSTKWKIGNIAERVAWNKIGVAINKEFYRFGCLRQSFRHDLHLQSSVFKAVSLVIQIMGENRPSPSLSP